MSILAPLDPLGAFSLRMASHGLSVSSALMKADPRYALEQLRHARDLGDSALQDLAAALFGDFKRQRSGVEPVR